MFQPLKLKNLGIERVSATVLSIRHWFLEMRLTSWSGQPLVMPYFSNTCSCQSHVMKVLKLAGFTSQ